MIFPDSQSISSYLRVEPSSQLFWALGIVLAHIYCNSTLYLIRHFILVGISCANQSEAKFLSFPQKFCHQNSPQGYLSIDLTKGKIELLRQLSFFPCSSELIDFPARDKFDRSSVAKTLASDWLAQIISTKMKCPLKYSVLVTQLAGLPSFNHGTVQWKVRFNSTEEASAPSFSHLACIIYLCTEDYREI